MNQINAIQTNEENEQVVSARELHKSLGSKKRFSDWWRQQVPNYVDGVDFTLSPESDIAIGNGATRKMNDYMLTTDTAKEIALMSGTEKGKQIRNYFIAAEKKLKQVMAQPIQPMTPMEMMETQFAILKEVKAENAELKTEFVELKESFGLPNVYAKRFTKSRNRRVIDVMGGYHGQAYNNKKVRGAVYKEMANIIKGHFMVDEYASIPLSRFDEAIQMVEAWTPSEVLQLAIDGSNAQTALEV